MVVISILATLVLYLSGAPLLSVANSKVKSFPDGSATVPIADFQLHWPLLAVCGAWFAGLVALVWPQRRLPELPS